MSPELDDGGSGGGGSGGGSDGSSMGYVGTLLPAWLTSLKPIGEAIRKYGAASAIGFFVLEWFIGGFVEFVANIVGLILGSFIQVAEIPILVGASLVKALGVAGEVVLLPWKVMTDLLVGVAAAAGPFGPIVFALGIWLAVELVIRGLPFVLRFIPVVGSPLGELLS